MTKRKPIAEPGAVVYVAEHTWCPSDPVVQTEVFTSHEKAFAWIVRLVTEDWDEDHYGPMPEEIDARMGVYVLRSGPDTSFSITGYALDGAGPRFKEDLAITGHPYVKDGAVVFAGTDPSDGAGVKGLPDSVTRG